VPEPLRATTRVKPFCSHVLADQGGCRRVFSDAIRPLVAKPSPTQVANGRPIKRPCGPVVAATKALRLLGQTRLQVGNQAIETIQLVVIRFGDIHAQAPVQGAEKA
jgi:hypothetical protein